MNTFLRENHAFIPFLHLSFKNVFVLRGSNIGRLSLLLTCCLKIYSSVLLHTKILHTFYSSILSLTLINIPLKFELDAGHYFHSRLAV